MGSAFGFTAGYSTIAIGTETEGSLVVPASRPALYIVKPTMPIIPCEGIVLITGFCDSVGSTRTVEDLADLIDDLVDPAKMRIPADGNISAVTPFRKGLEVGTLDPEVWTYSEITRKPEPNAEEQIVSASIPLFIKP